MDRIFQDLRHTLRSLRKHPGFTAVAILTLAIGIGANTAIFSVVNAVLLRPLPFAEPDRLAILQSIMHGELWTASPGDYAVWREQARSFQDLGAITPETFNLTGEGSAERVSGAAMTPNLLSVLGVSPSVGRAFGPEHATPGEDRVALLSHALWQRRFGADAGVVGERVTLDGEGYTVVGIMPERFELPRSAEVWTPLAFDAEDLANHGAHYITVLGRLRPGATVERADAELRAIAGSLAEEFPESNAGWSATVTDLHESVVGDLRPTLLLLLGAVGLLLLIACANVANLVLVRTIGRDRELAVRAALGAGRVHLIRSLLTESLVLGLLGGGAGTLLAVWGTSWLSSLQISGIPRLEDTSVDTRVLLFALAVSCLTAVIFGLLPALQAARRRDLTARLKEGGRGLSGERSGERVRGGLVVAQMTLAVILVVGAGLLMKSFVKIQQVDPGFETADRLTFNVSLPDARYTEPEQSEAYFASLIERIERLPGVEGASGVFGLPLSGFFYSISVLEVDGRRPESPDEEKSVQVRVVLPDYFRTIGTPVLRGRQIDESDRFGAPPVVVVNESAARLLWADEDPIGRAVVLGTGFGLGRGNVGGQVVGVVRDVKHFGLAGEPRPEVYMAHRQFPVDFMSVVVRSDSDPTALVEPIRSAAAELDPEVPIYRARTLEQLLDGSLTNRRFYMLLLTIFAAAALTLATVGIYGVVSYAVSRRTREIGLRVALGAGRSDVLRLVVRQGLTLAVVGLGLGLAGAFGVTRLLSSLLYGMQATDIATFVVVAIVLIWAAVLATFVPARRAVVLDPTIALRDE